MSIALNLLDDVRWRGRPVVGDRPRALLAALAARGCRPVPAEDLIELVWGDEAPVNGLKSLQVLVSRARTACGAEAIVRDGAGYRLGAVPDEVDSARLSVLARAATGALDRDAAAAAALARQALELTASLPGVGDGDAGPLAEVRRRAVTDADGARLVLARALSKTGAHAEALPALETAHAGHPRDEALLADLLRSEAVVRGPAAALERFARYQRDLRDRLGADPGELLQRAHRSLLALDRPVRRGVRYDATTLIGRDGDLERLRALLAGARVVSIVGPGGLGKTRLAHAIARAAAEPAVHVVELAGVTSADDLAGEVGSALGVRDSVSGRRVLTAEQRADVRARAAQLLGQSPALLVLDNCEHLIDAVAGLVAFLVASTADLRVLITSRAPLAIAAERVYLLGELDAGDAARLFEERAVAARPSVRLTERLVTAVVARLDGLPLAIELAAARARTMTLEEIDRRLGDRFALLRGGDRSAPGRHRTLFAVIDWSWNLLNASERRALSRLALFHDGFTLEAAEAVLGDDAVEAVQGLVDQSLLSVRETSAGGRYRMLETVREFGRMRLADAGEEAGARAAQRRWAAAYARHHGARVPSREQFAGIDALAAEEVNLADELRGALADGDRGALVQLLAALGFFWTVRGEHARLMVLATAVADALRDWSPPPELALASGDYATGLRLHREAAARMRAIRLPEVTMTGLEPWVLFGDSVTLSAHARYATGEDEAYGRALFLTCRGNAVRLLRDPAPGFDHPAAGQLLFALGAWTLLRELGPDEPVPGAGEGLAAVALRLLALASRFGYHRLMPTMMWDQLMPAAERTAPGRIGEFLAEYALRQPAAFLAEARRLAERLPG